MWNADDVASVIIARSGPWVDAWKLQKLLYYVQAWHLAVTDEPLFSERIKAWKDGPVVPQVRHNRKDRSTRRSTDQELSHVELDDFTSDLIDLVLGNYGSMSGDELRALTHVEQPWREARGDLPEDAPSNEEISLDSMARFYRNERRLGGRTAADLAAGGIYLMSCTEQASPVDVEALLAELGEDECDEYDPWGGANLIRSDEYGTNGIEQSERRAYAGC